ncbi:MAG: glycosyltransferase [Sulfolobales archaeon]|nr:glycosyltransferase [Sulfolobales archaeon]
MRKTLAIMYDGSFNSRHERGYIASLRLQGIDTLVISLDENVNEPIVCKEIIEVNNNTVKIPVIKLPSINAFVYENLLTKLLADFHVESIITLPRTPYLLTYRISRKLKVPFIVRFWSIRALKLVDNLKHGAYSDLLLFIPSLITNLTEALMSDGIIVSDDVIYKALKELGVNRVRSLVKVYPPAGFSLRGKLNNNVIEKIREAEPYVLAMTVLSKTGAYLKFEAKPHSLLFYYLAKRIPSINFLIGGSNKEEFVRIFPNIRNKMPKNLIFIGRGFTDDTLKILYQHSIATVTYISNRSISNRLLEAMALNTVIVTNPLALSLHPELTGSIVIAHSADDYQKAIKDIVKDDNKRDELREKLRETYLKYFSPELNSTLTLKIVDLASYTSGSKGM